MREHTYMKHGIRQPYSLVGLTSQPLLNCTLIHLPRVQVPLVVVQMGGARIAVIVCSADLRRQKSADPPRVIKQFDMDGALLSSKRLHATDSRFRLAPRSFYFPARPSQFPWNAPEQLSPTAAWDC